MPFSERARVIGSVAAAVIAFVAPRSRADGDVKGAEALLKEGLALEDKKDFAAACPKFEESLQHFSSVNTEYYLADCYEHVGKTASAWKAFVDVADKAHEKKETAKEKRARDRAAKIEAKVSRLTVDASAAKADGLIVKLDGVEVANDQLGVATPIDPGDHSIEANAPGKRAWNGKVTVAPDGVPATIVIPALADVKKETPPPPPPPKPVEAHGSSLGTVGLVIGAGGLAAMGVGTFLAFSAKSTYHDADAHCGIGGDANACDQQGLDTRDKARSRGNVATIVFGVGVAAVVAGGVIWFTAPKGDSTAVGASVGPGSLSVIGRF